MPGKVRSELVLGGKTFWMTPLSDKDIQELDLYVRQQFMEAMYATLPDSISEQDRKDSIQYAQATAAGLTFMSGQGARIMATVPGMTRLTWQMLSAEHPDLTQTELHDLLLDPANILEVNKRYAEVHSNGKKRQKRWTDQGSQSKNKKKRKKRGRKR